MIGKMPDRAQVIVAVVAAHGPKVSADREAIMKSPDDVLRGLRLVMNALGATRGTVAVHRNRSDLVRRMTQVIGDSRDVDVVRIDPDEDASFSTAGEDAVALNASMLLAVARAVQEESAAAEEIPAATVISPMGRDYQYLIEQAGGTRHAPYRVMIEGG